MDQQSLARTDTPTTLGEDLSKAQQQPPATRQPYVYVERTTPNPDAKPKTRSKIGQFLSKFKSPAVKATTAIRDREDLEAERTGVKKIQGTDVGRSSNAWALS